MKSKPDYSCEIIGLTVLTVLSAVSHFWYVMIAIGILGGVGAMGVVIYTVFLRAKREMLTRFFDPVRIEHATVVRDVR